MNRNFLEDLKAKRDILKLSAIAFIGAVSMFGVSHGVHADENSLESTTLPEQTISSNTKGMKRKLPKSDNALVNVEPAKKVRKDDKDGKLIDLFKTDHDGAEVKQGQESKETKVKERELEVESEDKVESKEATDHDGAAEEEEQDQKLIAPLKRTLSERLSESASLKDEEEQSDESEMNASANPVVKRPCYISEVDAFSILDEEDESKDKCEGLLYSAKNSERPKVKYGNSLLEGEGYLSDGEEDAMKDPLDQDKDWFSELFDAGSEWPEEEYRNSLLDGCWDEREGHLSDDEEDDDMNDLQDENRDDQSTDVDMTDSSDEDATYLSDENITKGMNALNIGEEGTNSSSWNSFF